MSHDLYAAWASSEVALSFQSNPQLCFDTPPQSIVVFASHERDRSWPRSDGVVIVEDPGNVIFSIALEFKRQNEGIHGVLTAIGQAHAYLNKNFSAAAIVIPRIYESHNDPGTFVGNVLRNNSPDLPIAVFTYEDPDPSRPRPFERKMSCVHKLTLDTQRRIAEANVAARVETQWGHVREGSSDPDAFFRYLQIAKSGSFENANEAELSLPGEVTDAIEQNSPGAVPKKYLSNTSGDSFSDRVWRAFWFTHVLTPTTIPIWRARRRGQYEINRSPSNLVQPNNDPKYFFVGRTDSIKNRLILELNNGSIDENIAFARYVQNIRDRAHSYREDIDSGLEALGLLEPDGKPTKLGYRFVDACERTGLSHQGLPRQILGAALLQNGNLAAFLHYVYRLSDQKFSQNCFAFAVGRGIKKRIDIKEYLKWLRKELSETLLVMRTVSARGGLQRPPFQAEIAILRHFDFVRDYRIGVGLEINWPAIQEGLEFEL